MPMYAAMAAAEPTNRSKLSLGACIRGRSLDGNSRSAWEALDDLEAGAMARTEGRAREAGTDTGRATPRAVPASGFDRFTVARLVARSQEGDREAFGLLYRAYRRRVFSLARFSLPTDAAEDALAETFVRAWSAVPRYRDTGAPFVAWLYGIARHVVADMHRARARVDPHDDSDREWVDTASTAEADVDRLMLQAALEKLPDEQRTVVELKFLAGLSNEEVGAALGKSPGAVNTQQWRALSALRELMGAPEELR